MSLKLWVYGDRAETFISDASLIQVFNVADVESASGMSKSIGGHDGPPDPRIEGALRCNFYGGWAGNQPRIMAGRYYPWWLPNATL